MRLVEDHGQGRRRLRTVDANQRVPRLPQEVSRHDLLLDRLKIAQVDDDELGLIDNSKLYETDALYDMFDAVGASGFSTKLSRRFHATTPEREVVNKAKYSPLKA